MISHSKVSTPINGTKMISRSKVSTPINGSQRINIDTKLTTRPAVADFIKEGINLKDPENMSKIGSNLKPYQIVRRTQHREQWDKQSKEGERMRIKSYCTEERVREKRCPCVSNKHSECLSRRLN